MALTMYKTRDRVLPLMVGFVVKNAHITHAHKVFMDKCERPNDLRSYCSH